MSELLLVITFYSYLYIVSKDKSVQRVLKLVINDKKKMNGTQKWEYKVTQKK